jgi:hypothetical protein
MDSVNDQESPASGADASAARPPTRRFGVDRFTLGIVLGAVVLVALLCAVILARPNDSQPMDETRPAGVVHNFYLALLRNDPKTAYSYLSAEAQSKQPYERFAAQYSGPRPEQRLRIDDEQLEGDTARVTLRWSSGGGGGFPFGSGEFTSTRTVVLRREGEAWKLAQPVYGFY